jgi:hypothetical protein
MSDAYIAKALREKITANFAVAWAVTALVLGFAA